VARTLGIERGARRSKNCAQVFFFIRHGHRPTAGSGDQLFIKSADRNVVLDPAILMPGANGCVTISLALVS
jgi:hypothetical protein